ncbi:MAG: hypothetical protein JO031_00780 [Ktedonobacteraceae bacterium]|nr:hypothetical protein [Ktedonobacteraceae bacterium]
MDITIEKGIVCCQDVQSSGGLQGELVKRDERTIGAQPYPWEDVHHRPVAEGKYTDGNVQSQVIFASG